MKARMAEQDWGPLTPPSSDVPASYISTALYKRSLMLR